ncbi:MAG: sensor domain-containing diguanylate cyclase [Burkholderiales bacterium]|nr:sensor domain-containing diguanylate cyclase [Burkholderiales bacterium]
MAKTPKTGLDSEFERSLITAIYEASPDGILVVDDREMIVAHNQRFFEVFGISSDEIPGDHGGVLTSKSEWLLLSRALELVSDPEGFRWRVEELYANPQIEEKCEIAMKDGRTLERNSRALWGEQNRYLGRVWFFRDITEHKKIQDALLEMSQLDPLTGVANRRCFDYRASGEFLRARRFGRDLSVVMLDIDHFKRINDRWGHAAGDKVLKKLCESVQAELREVDLLARVGGEEFAVLMPDTNLDGAFLLAERLRRCVMAQELIEGEDIIKFTASFGVAALGSEDKSPDDVLKRADVALYAAKGAGRNRTMRESPG